MPPRPRLSHKIQRRKKKESNTSKANTLPNGSWSCVLLWEHAVPEQLDQTDKQRMLVEEVPWFHRQFLVHRVLYECAPISTQKVPAPAASTCLLPHRSSLLAHCHGHPGVWARKVKHGVAWDCGAVWRGPGRCGRGGGKDRRLSWAQAGIGAGKNWQEPIIKRYLFLTFAPFLLVFCWFA
jgi:hypothetical protein